MKDLKIGLKQFSDRLEFFREDIIKEYANGKFDYIELYVYPGSMAELYGWERLKIKSGIPFTVHAPHSSQGVNLAKAELLDFNRAVYEQIDMYMDALDAKYMIIHSGKDGSIEETVRQLHIIKPKRVMIENKPYHSQKSPDLIYTGAKFEEIKYVKDNFACGFCLDVGHAFCTAVSLGIDQFEYLEKFMELKPNCYHLSDGEFNEKLDKHLHLGKGDYDWNKIFKIIDTSKNMTLETILKNDKNGLDEFLKDAEEVGVHIKH